MKPSRRSYALAVARVVLTICVLGAFEDCKDDPIDLSGGLDVTPVMKDDIENAQLTFSPPGPFSLGEGQEIEVIVEARNHRTGELRPALETLTRLEGTGNRIIEVVNTGGTDGVSDGRKTYRVVGVSRGTAQLQASIDPTIWRMPKSGPLAESQIDVVGSVTQLSVNPIGPLNVAVGSTFTIVARALDANGTQVPAAEELIDSNLPSFFLSTETITRLPLDGAVTYVYRVTQAGSGTIKFSYRASTGVQVRTVQITAGPLPTQLRIVTNPLDLPSDPAKETIPLAFGTTRQYEVRDQSNVALTTYTFNWISTTPSVAVVDANGLVGCIAGGQSRVGVELPNSQLSAFADLQCTRVLSVIMTPSTPVGSAATDMLVAQQIQASAIVSYLNGAPVTPAATITWKSDNPTVADVSPSGRITAFAAGQAVIRAAAEGVFAAAPLSVRVITPAPRADSIAFSPSGTDAVRTVGDQFGFAGVMYDQFRNPFFGATVTWRIADPTIARVVSSTSSGDFHRVTVEALSAGTTTIVPESPGVTKTSPALTITVGTAAPISNVFRIELEPKDASITSPSSQQYRVMFYNAAGNQITVESGGSLEFTSSNPAVATFNSLPGLASGAAAGVSTISARYLRNGTFVRQDASPLTVYAAGTAGHYGSITLSTDSLNKRTMRAGGVLLLQLIVRNPTGTQVTSGITPAPTVTSSNPGVISLAPAAIGGGYFHTMTAAANAPVGTKVTFRYDVMGAGGTITMTIVP
ncbi:MAG: Ig-like domain-containing protein [Gemmatimonas sp.]